MPQHALGDIQCHALGCREALCQLAAEMPGAAAQIEPVLRLAIDRQRAQQLLAHAALQLGHGIVAGRRPGEGRRYLTLVRQSVLTDLGRAQGISHRAPR